MFAPFVTDGTIKKLSKGKYNDVLFRQNTWFLIYKQDNNIIDSTPFCYSFALSEMEHDKSTTYPKITTILFDEFLTRSYYLNDEFIIFCNCLSTIIRDRNNVKIFMCGNTVNKYAPYFTEMGITNIKNMRQGNIDVYNYGKSNLRVAVEYCATAEKVKKKSDVYFAFNNPRLEMVKSGSWEIGNYPHLPYKYKPKDIIFTFFIIFSTDILQCEIITNENGMFVYVHKKTSPLKDKSTDLIYDLQAHSEYNKRSTFLKCFDNTDRKIYNLYRGDKFFYQNNEVGEIVNNFIKSEV